MICPACGLEISNKRKKQVKHLRRHPTDELIGAIIWLRAVMSDWEKQDRQLALDDPATLATDDPNGECSCFECRQQRGALALDDPAGLLPVPGDVFRMVEEDNEEDSGEIPTELETYLSELYPSADPVVPLTAPVEQPALDATKAALETLKHITADVQEQYAHLKAEYAKLKAIADEHYAGLTYWQDKALTLIRTAQNEQPADTGEYAEVKYIRIDADGPEFQLLNALALYCRRSMGK